MNDEWSRCPICFEDYSLAHRPTTFVCGHSTCILHTVGLNRLRYCPICRHLLREQDEYHVSYNLEEASRLFQLIKNTIDWSTVKLPSASVTNNDENSASALINGDEVYARRLQAEFNREVRNQTQQRTQVSTANHLPPVQAITVVPTSSRINESKSHQKSCGHRCELISTNQCCPCSDRRPQRLRYETYVDGRGIENHATRNEFYCPSCKRR